MQIGSGGQTSSEVTCGDVVGPKGEIIPSTVVDIITDRLDVYREFDRVFVQTSFWCCKKGARHNSQENIEAKKITNS